jgi:hypothetical protein
MSLPASAPTIPEMMSVYKKVKARKENEAQMEANKSNVLKEKRAMARAKNRSK